MLKKYLDLTQVCILVFSNIERGNGEAGTYAVDITVMNLSFNAIFQHNLSMVLARVYLTAPFMSRIMRCIVITVVLL